MPKKTSLDRLFHQAMEYPGPSSRLAALEVAYRAVEEQLAHARAQETVRTHARLQRERATSHPDDIEDEEYKLSRTVDQILPKVFRGGLLLSVWSVFEACVKDIAEYSRRERKLPFGLQELRAGDFLGQMARFFNAVLGIKAFPDRKVRKQIEELKGLRNALAHHDGNVDELPKSLVAPDEKGYAVLGLTMHSDLHHSYVVPNAEYVRRSLDLVKIYLESLSEQVYNSLHPESNDEDT
jgi:hypothetical protein